MYEAADQIENELAFEGRTFDVQLGNSGAFNVRMLGTARTLNVQYNGAYTVWQGLAVVLEGADVNADLELVITALKAAK